MEHKFNADDLFVLEEDTNSTFPLNLDFIQNPKLTTDFPGPGLYFLYFKDELVYIGFFHPNGDKEMHAWSE
jgi:hypothetical protein